MTSIPLMQLPIILKESRVNLLLLYSMWCGLYFTPPRLCSSLRRYKWNRTCLEKKSYPSTIGYARWSSIGKLVEGDLLYSSWVCLRHLLLKIFVSFLSPSFSFPFSSFSFRHLKKRPNRCPKRMTPPNRTW